MTKTYYKAEISYMKPDEVSGDEKLVSEVFLFDAVSYTDAEILVAKTAEVIIPGRSYTVKKIDKLQLAALVVDNEKAYYLAKLEYDFENDKGQIKKVKVNALVAANDIKNAAELAHAEFGLTNPEVLAVAKTNILEYFKEAPKADENPY